MDQQRIFRFAFLEIAVTESRVQIDGARESQSCERR